MEEKIRVSKDNIKFYSGFQKCYFTENGLLENMRNLSVKLPFEELFNLATEVNNNRHTLEYKPLTVTKYKSLAIRELINEHNENLIDIKPILDEYKITENEMKLIRFIEDYWKNEELELYYTSGAGTIHSCIGGLHSYEFRQLMNVGVSITGFQDKVEKNPIYKNLHLNIVSTDLAKECFFMDGSLYVPTEYYTKDREYLYYAIAFAHIIKDPGVVGKNRDLVDKKISEFNEKPLVKVYNSSKNLIQLFAFSIIYGYSIKSLFYKFKMRIRDYQKSIDVSGLVIEKMKDSGYVIDALNSYKLSDRFSDLITLNQNTEFVYSED